MGTPRRTRAFAAIAEAEEVAGEEAKAGGRAIAILEESVESVARAD